MGFADLGHIFFAILDTVFDQSIQNSASSSDPNP